jgi:hypothetical protein
VESEGQNPVDPAGSGQNHLPVTIGTPANGLAVTEAQVLTIDKAQIFAGTSSQFVKGDGTLDSNTYLTTGIASATYVPYTGATADVNLGTHDLAAERGTFANNGSSDALTVNHTSGSGYGIIVTKGGNNEALYVSKTSGSGNAMTVVGGRTSLVDLALSSVTNTAGDFLTISGGVVHKRTAAQTLTDIGGQAALTNPVTGTGTTNYLPKFTGTSTIGNSIVSESGAALSVAGTLTATQGNFTATANTYAGSSLILKAFGGTNPIYLTSVVGLFAISNGGSADHLLLNASGNLGLGVTPSAWASTSKAIQFGGNAILENNGDLSAYFGFNGYRSASGWIYLTNNAVNLFGAEASSGFAWYQAPSGTAGNAISFTQTMRLTSGGNLLVGTTTDAGFKLDVNGTGRFSGSVTATGNAATTPAFIANNPSGAGGTAQHYIDFTAGATVIGRILRGNGASGLVANGLNIDNFDGCQIRLNQLGGSGGSFNVLGGNVGIGTTAPSGALHISGNAYSSSRIYLQRTSGAIGTYSLGVQTANNCFGIVDEGQGSLTRFLINAAGSVGIGTTSPSGAAGLALAINGGASQTRIALKNSFTGDAAGDGFQILLDAGAADVVFENREPASIIFATNTTERMRITSGGNVLIGTTTDNGAKLQVNGTLSLAVSTATGKSLSGVYFPIVINGTTYYLPIYA